MPCDDSLQVESIQKNKRTRSANKQQPQKRADGLRSYLEPSQSVRAHFVCAPESLVQTDSPECALSDCIDGQLCVRSESCTDGQTTASRERAKALLGMAEVYTMLSLLQHCVPCRSFLFSTSLTDELSKPVTPFKNIR